MGEDFDISLLYSKWSEIILSILCIISLLCATRLTQVLRKLRLSAQSQAKFMINHSMDNLINNNADYALTEFVILMSISDIIRAIIQCLQYLTSAFHLWHECSPDSPPGTICLLGEFIKWTLMSIDIVCYGVICFCLFRYLRKRTIFTSHSITPRRIYFAIITISVLCSSTQTFLVVLHEDYDLNHQIIYVPLLVVLYCTILYVLSVFAYIRCCHPFWILGKATKSQCIFLLTFFVIFIVPITFKVLF